MNINSALLQKVSLQPQFTSKAKEKQVTSPIAPQTQKLAKLPLGNIYGAKINFRGNDYNPAQEILDQASIDGKPYTDYYTLENSHYGVNRGDKRWIAGVEPQNLLKRPLDHAINSIMTLTYGRNMPDKIPSNIQTPNFGDSWGRYANYIEINNRALAQVNGDRTQGAMLGAIKMLPAIPPSHDKWANCLVVSQLYPNIYGDGWNNNGENSLYGIKLEYERLSDNIGWTKIGDRVFTPEEQTKAFNDLAHLRGFKTSFRMVISEDQIKIGDSGQFRWHDDAHLEAFIQACVKGVNLGFDGIFFDSIKHVGGYDWGNYTGVGATPDEGKMGYILNEIRSRTGRYDLSFSGEKTHGDQHRYKNMGMTAGTAEVSADSACDIKRMGKGMTWSSDFASGPVVSDDNDTGAQSYEQRLNKISNSLFAYDHMSEKLPSFMQMHDLFPLNYETNSHDLMMENKRFSHTGDQYEHYDNLFANTWGEVVYRDKVNETFAWMYDHQD